MFVSASLFASNLPLPQSPCNLLPPSLSFTQQYFFFCCKSQPGVFNHIHFPATLFPSLVIMALHCFFWLAIASSYLPASFFFLFCFLLFHQHLFLSLSISFWTAFPFLAPLMSPKRLCLFLLATFALHLDLFQSLTTRSVTPRPLPSPLLAPHTNPHHPVSLPRCSAPPCTHRPLFVG